MLEQLTGRVEGAKAERGRGRSCGTLWAVVRTLTFTLSEMELREGSEQERALICLGRS